MPSFTQVAKFLGFTAEKEGLQALSKVPGEAAAFIKGLEAAEPVRFLHTEEEGFKQIRMMQGEKKLGLLKYKEFGEGYTVMGIAGEAKGAGYQMRTELARVAQERGKQFLISDIYGSMSYDEVQAWMRLQEQGKAIAVNVPFAELGPEFAGRQGTKAAYRWNLRPATIAPDKAVQLLKDRAVTETVMHLGQGHDNSSMLRRSLNSSAQGSRKMTGAL
jgi:hypothetical protein